MEENLMNYTEWYRLLKKRKKKKMEKQKKTKRSRK